MFLTKDIAGGNHWRKKEEVLIRQLVQLRLTVIETRTFHRSDISIWLWSRCFFSEVLEGLKSR